MVRIELSVVHYSVDTEDFTKKQADLISKLKKIGNIIDERRRGEWATVVMECRETDIELVNSLIRHYVDYKEAVTTI